MNSEGMGIKENTHILSSFPKPWDGKMDLKQNFPHFALAASGTIRAPCRKQNCKAGTPGYTGGREQNPSSCQGGNGSGQLCFHPSAENVMMGHNDGLCRILKIKI